MDRTGTARLFAAVGLLAAGCYMAPLLGGAADAVLYDLIGLSVVVAIAVGVRRHRPRARAPWALLALGQLLFVLGDTNLVVHELVLHRPSPTPSLTDLFWLPAYPVLTASLLLMLRAQRRGSDQTGLVDSTILSSGSVLLVWTYVVAPLAAQDTDRGVEQVLAVTYPALDLLLLTVTLRLAVGTATSAPALRLLVGSALGVFLGDVLHAGELLLGDVPLAAFAHPFWLAGYVLAGTAALHPSMRRVDGGHGEDDGEVAARPPTGRRLWLLAACCLLSPAVLVVEWARGEHSAVPVIAGTSAGMFLLVVCRISLMARSAQELTGLVATQRGERRFRALVQGASDVIVVVGPDGTVVPETPSVTAVLGYDADALRGRPLTALFTADDAERLLQPGSGSAPQEVQLRSGTGGWMTVEVARQDLSADPEVGGIVLTIRDVGERKAWERRLQHQASHDALTGLPDRRLFHARLGEALATTPAEPLSVLFLDLDDFKTVNDTLGHHWGDRLLVVISDRLRGVLRSDDVLCRLGGDEFVVLLPGLTGEQACVVAERVRDAIVAPLDLEGRTVRVGASIGVCDGLSGSGQGADELLASADTAMYVSKRSGRDRWTLFQADMHTSVVRRSAVETGLREAVQQGALTVAYQPVVRFGTGAIVGFEALVRWTSPELGLVPPDEFVPIAEETGLVVPLGRLVLEQACAFLAGCNADRDEPVRVAVNVSVRQLQEPHFVATVQAVLAATGVPAHLLTLEITESIRLFDGSAQVLHHLKAVGVRLALDDFGTGYAALTHVTSLPIDEIKIDRSFVRALEDRGREAQLAASVVRLGQQLDLVVVAEGVETRGQAEQLTALGCDLAQGYLYGRPQPPADARAALHAQDERVTA